VDTQGGGSRSLTLLLCSQWVWHGVPNVWVVCFWCVGCLVAVPLWHTSPVVWWPGNGWERPGSVSGSGNTLSPRRPLECRGLGRVCRHTRPCRAMRLKVEAHCFRVEGLSPHPPSTTLCVWGTPHMQQHGSDALASLQRYWVGSSVQGATLLLLAESIEGADPSVLNGALCVCFVVCWY